MRAIQKMQRAAADDELRAIMEYREKAELDHLQRIKNAQKEGELKGEKRGIMLGKQEGIKEEKYLVARQLLRLNVNIETISTATGLSIDDIKKLMN